MSSRSVKGKKDKGKAASPKATPKGKVPPKPPTPDPEPVPVVEEPVPVVVDPEIELRQLAAEVEALVTQATCLEAEGADVDEVEEELGAQKKAVADRQSELAAAQAEKDHEEPILNGVKLSAREIEVSEYYIANAQRWFESEFQDELRSMLNDWRLNNDREIESLVDTLLLEQERWQAQIQDLKDVTQEQASALRRGLQERPPPERTFVRTQTSIRNQGATRRAAERVEPAQSPGSLKLLGENGELGNELEDLNVARRAKNNERSQLLIQLRTIRNNLKRDTDEIESQMRKLRSQLDSDVQRKQEIDRSNSREIATVEFLANNVRDVRMTTPLIRSGMPLAIQPRNSN